MDKESNQSTTEIPLEVAENNTPTDKNNRSDTDVARWIKNLGALVTIFTAIIGLWFTAYQLRLKSDADRETASMNREAEVDKLRLGEEQISDQKEARKKQSDEHKKDLDLELENHRLDIQQARDVIADQDAKTKADRLSTLITHMFSGAASSEGDLAGLFEFLDKNPSSREVVENAVLARMADPRSPEEIDLAFRIFEHIGVEAVAYTIQANRNAKRRYNDYLYARFREVEAKGPAAYASMVEDQSEKAASVGFPASTTKSVEEDIVAEETSLALDRFYVFALLNSRSAAGSEQYKLQDQKDSVGYQPLALAIALIERSNRCLQDQIVHLDARRPLYLDLTDTYLTPLKDDAASVIHNHNLVLDVKGAYIAERDKWPPGKCKGARAAALTMYNARNTPLAERFEFSGLTADCKFEK